MKTKEFMNKYLEIVNREKAYRTIVRRDEELNATTVATTYKYRNFDFGFMVYDEELEDDVLLEIWLGGSVQDLYVTICDENVDRLEEILDKNNVLEEYTKYAR